MRPTTDDKGVTTVELSLPDRKTFARAKNLALELVHLEWGKEISNTARTVVEGLVTILQHGAAAEAPVGDHDFKVEETD